jgi:hypothetical protein
VSEFYLDVVSAVDVVEKDQVQLALVQQEVVLIVTREIIQGLSCTQVMV